MNTFDSINTLLSLDNVLRVLILVVLVGYMFFSLFLYLRLRILSLTLQTQYAGFLRYASLLNLVGTFAVFVLLGLLVWLI